MSYRELQDMLSEQLRGELALQTYYDSLKSVPQRRRSERSEAERRQHNTRAETTGHIPVLNGDFRAVVNW